MSHWLFPHLGTLTLAVLILNCACGCTHVSGSGRSQFNVLSVSQETSLGDQAFDEVLTPAEGAAPRLIATGAQWEQVQRVSARVFASANRQHREIAQQFDWEIVLIDDAKTVNAWALPGGKCAVYTGLLKVADTDDMLAVVLGHETAHAIARHGGERISQGLILQLIGAGLVLGDLPPTAQSGAMLALGVGSLKFDREQESEADAIGLLISADAGFNPTAALTLWTKMGDQASGGVPEFLSTHPSFQTRLERLRAIMPRAEAIYTNRLASPDPTGIFKNSRATLKTPSADRNR